MSRRLGRSKSPSGSTAGATSDAPPPLQNPGAEVLRTKRGICEPRDRLELAQILKEAPDNADANFEIGLLEYDDKLYDQAIVHLIKRPRYFEGAATTVCFLRWVWRTWNGIKKEKTLNTSATFCRPKKT